MKASHWLVALVTAVIGVVIYKKAVQGDSIGDSIKVWEK